MESGLRYNKNHIAGAQTERRERCRDRRGLAWQ
jgi:hypothetical protein